MGRNTMTQPPPPPMPPPPLPPTTPARPTTGTVAATLNTTTPLRSNNNATTTNHNTSNTSNNTSNNAPATATTTAPTPSLSGTSSKNQKLQEKAEEINLVLLQPDVDLWKLRDLALTEGGLVNDTLRKRAWPKLVGLHKYYHHNQKQPTHSSTNTNATPSQNETLETKPQDASVQPAPSPTEPTVNTQPSETAVVEEESKLESVASEVLQPPPSPPASATTLPSETDAEGEPELERDASPVLPPPSPPASSATLPSETAAEGEPKFEIDASAVLPPQAEFTLSERGGTDVKPFDYLIAESIDAGQIERDVARCTWHLLTGNQRFRRIQYEHKHRKKVISLLKKKQRRLANLINLALVESYPQAPSVEERLRYYQGYHDVACIFLHALGGGNTNPNKNQNNDGNVDDDEKDRLGLELPARVLCQVSHSHFRDHLKNNFSSLQTALKVALFPLLWKLDKKVHNHLQDCDMEPFFCLSWVITWFSHDVRDTALVKRLFDAFLCSHPLFPLYVSIAMMLHPINRRLILHTDCDFAALHHCLAMLPRNSCRVGWKQRLDGGFESDEEGVDDRTVSTDMDSQHWDNSLLGGASMSLATQSSMAAASGNSSLNSFSIGPISVESTYERVPFQTLIDKGLEYMRRYPPRCLLKLAQKYHRDQWQIDMASMSSISLLQDPPSWSLAGTTKADWVLKQRVRQDLGMSTTSRKDRRLKSRHSPKNNDDKSSTPSAEEAATPLVDYEYLKRNRTSRAVIAAGFGPGLSEERARRRRKRMMKGAIAAGVVAVVAIGVMHLYQPARSLPTVKPSFNPTDVQGSSCAATDKPLPPTTERNKATSSSTSGGSYGAGVVVDPNTVATSTQTETLNVKSTAAKPLDVGSRSSNAFPEIPPATISEGPQEPKSYRPFQQVAQKMTLSIYRFVFHLFRPFRMLLQYDNESFPQSTNNSPAKEVAPGNAWIKQFWQDLGKMCRMIQSHQGVVVSSTTKPSKR